MRTRIFFAIFLISSFLLILLQAFVLYIVHNSEFVLESIFIAFLCVVVFGLILAFYISKIIVKPLLELDINELDKDFNCSELKTFLTQDRKSVV